MDTDGGNHWHRAAAAEFLKSEEVNAVDCRIQSVSPAGTSSHLLRPTPTPEKCVGGGSQGTTQADSMTNLSKGNEYCTPYAPQKQQPISISEKRKLGRMQNLRTPNVVDDMESKLDLNPSALSSRSRRVLGKYDQTGDPLTARQDDPKLLRKISKNCCHSKISNGPRQSLSTGGKADRFDQKRSRDMSHGKGEKDQGWTRKTHLQSKFVMADDSFE
ncbi:hypothetical protein BGY98DRAFT_1145971 [Russula aff. rugulosa BPL654]|nr:hypothetical protein BGY98DRAFT_1145971 [Russula aff. rugulosa BPL654]